MAFQINEGNMAYSIYTINNNKKLNLLDENMENMFKINLKNFFLSVTKTQKPNESLKNLTTKKFVEAKEKIIYKRKNKSVKNIFNS